MKHRILFFLLVTLGILALAGCSNVSNEEAERATAGAILGGAAGAVIGNQSGNPETGAAIGAATGAAAGAMSDEED